MPISQDVITDKEQGQDSARRHGVRLDLFMQIALLRSHPDGNRNKHRYGGDHEDY
jgi:hypothetical protein